LDYFGARYYGSAQGRFTSPDPLSHAIFTKEKQSEFLANPQRWNKYVYVLNNPLRYVDPTGLAEVPTWDNLNADVRRDLQKRLGKDAKDIWDNKFDNNKRQAVVNARAQLMAAGVWDNVTSIGFAKVSAETSYNSTSYKMDTKVTMFTMDNKEGWELAVTTNKDIRSALEAQGFYKQTLNHPEAEWQLKQPEQNGTDISLSRPRSQSPV
jgi:RHS repeat-associated protein